ncbi:thioredoxin domain-containing protein [Mycobacterium lacus]|uniref:Thiol reductase thioredoxin n=1 Tax=Mycobacterium lacus TaxID=169765 RepID=A0A1X1XLH6_9MYCO|nr:thioredoxin domain-containing protein [Mycobacterium lacus]MCV7123710.1 thioredoxin [Mycobacterium lacus]ORV99620.1 thioredoxin [Mycobacterium lacus]BBX96042.1 thiol reductase thioredoxin [Mycobacterium lacus]
MGTRDLTAENFKRTINSNDNVLVYFWAPLCAPCDVFTPTYQASSEKNFDIVHGKVNFETEQELTSVAQVTLLPTLMAFKKGKLVFKQAGIANPAVMDELVRHLRAYRFKVESSPPAQQGLL